MDRDDFLALERAEAAELELTDTEREIASLLNQLRDAETELAVSERAYESFRESLAS